MEKRLQRRQTLRKQSSSRQDSMANISDEEKEEKHEVSKVSKGFKKFDESHKPKIIKKATISKFKKAESKGIDQPILSKASSKREYSDSQIKADMQKSLGRIKEQYLSKNFDTVNEIVDILLSQDALGQTQELEEVKEQLDFLLSQLCELKDQDFNSLLFSVRPIERNLIELYTAIDNLKKNALHLREELTCQSSLESLRQLELKSLYYQELASGIACFEKLEKAFEEVDQLSEQENFLFASKKVQALEKVLNEESDIRTLVRDFSMMELMKKRLQDRSKQLQTQILSSIEDILFIRHSPTCQQKVKVLFEFFESKLPITFSSAQEVIHQICIDNSELQRVQEQLAKIHRKDQEGAQKVLELLTQFEHDRSLASETIATGLICLQKDRKQAVKELNLAYLILMYCSYSQLQKDRLQDYLRTKIDLEMQNLCVRVLSAMLSLKREGQKGSEGVIADLLEVSAWEMKLIQQMVSTFFYFFQANMSYFMVLDKLDGAIDEEGKGITYDYINAFLYYLKMLIQILFDHDRKIQEFNNRNSLLSQIEGSAPKVKIEKNMRFSFRNKENGEESYLTSDVRLKLDFISKLEDLLVPRLIKKNICLVTTLGNKFILMIEGLVVLAEKNLPKVAASSLKAFQGWMKRFIVTNYEIFLDHFKQRAQFEAQKYFNVPAEVVGQEAAMDSVFAFVEGFVYAAHLAVDRIPLQEKDKQDQALFRQEVLDAVVKVMKKIVDKVKQVVGDCTKGTHKDNLFKQNVYDAEKQACDFTILVKQQQEKQSEENKGEGLRDFIYIHPQLEQKDDSLGIDGQEFLLRPKLQVEAELLHNNIATLTLLLKVYHQLKNRVLKDLDDCYRALTQEGKLEKELSDELRSQFKLLKVQMQDVLNDIVVFFRCELLVRIFFHLRELVRVDFTGFCVSTRVESFALALVRDMKILHNVFSEQLSSFELYYLFSHSLRSLFLLYSHYIRFLHLSRLDENGYSRLRGSLLYLKIELDPLLPRLLASDKLGEGLRQAVEESAGATAREFEKAIYVLEVLESEEGELPFKIKENDFGLKFKDFEALLKIQTHKHAAMSEVKMESLRKVCP